MYSPEDYNSPITSIICLSKYDATYFYDDDHNLIQTTDPVGMVTSITYDKLGRRSTVTVPGKTASDLLTTITSYDTAHATRQKLMA